MADKGAKSNPFSFFGGASSATTTSAASKLSIVDDDDEIGAPFPPSAKKESVKSTPAVPKQAAAKPISIFSEDDEEEDIFLPQAAKKVPVAAPKKAAKEENPLSFFSFAAEDTKQTGTAPAKPAPIAQPKKLEDEEDDDFDDDFGASPPSNPTPSTLIHLQSLCFFTELSICIVSTHWCARGDVICFQFSFLGSNFISENAKCDSYNQILIQIWI
jgi:hypothetical protein